MDRLTAMQWFVRVAERGSFAAVAAQLGVARSVVTRQIAALEKHLGVPLLLRSTRRLTLSSAGAAYLVECRAILQQVEACEAKIGKSRQMPKGSIRLSVPLSYGISCLAPLFIDFFRHYPDISLDVDYTDRRVNLVAEGFDLSLRITRHLHHQDIVRRLGAIQLHLLAAPAYLAKQGCPQHPRELMQHHALLYTGGASPDLEFEIDGNIESYPIHGNFCANNGDALCLAAAAGMGITCQPDFIAAPYVARGELQIILDNYPQPQPGIYAILPHNRHIPYPVQVLLEFLAKNIR